MIYELLDAVGWLFAPIGAFLGTGLVHGTVLALITLILTVTVLGGKLGTGFKTDGTRPGGDQAAGYIDYVMTSSLDAGWGERGSFYYHPRSFVPLADPDPNSLDIPASSMSGDAFAFWGNNWLDTTTVAKQTAWNNVFTALGFVGTPGSGATSATATGGNFLRLGSDLRGSIVPEPRHETCSARPLTSPSTGDTTCVA